MNQTISCKALARITTPQTLKIEGPIKKKKVQEVKDHIEKEEMNPTISCNSLFKITTPQTIKIEGHIKKKNVQEVKDHIKHQEMNPTTSCKGLEEITTSQTLEIEGHIKKKKLVVLIDSGSTHNCIHCGGWGACIIDKRSNPETISLGFGGVPSSISDGVLVIYF